MIDEFPVFAVAAACAEGVTLVREAEELRHKESDRITAVAHELQAIGVAIEPLPDGFRITGGPVAGGTVQPHGDHRIAMSCAVAGLVSRAPVVVEGAEIMHESFPAFGETLTALRTP
jgi:3-phosphoshikimate 1-carboxyvinyltransferase